MRDRRQQKRFLNRSKISFRANERAYTGQSTNFSLDGLFIETDSAFTRDTSIDMEVYLPDGSTSQLLVKVVRTSQLPSTNGIGVSVVKKDPNYLHLIRSLLSDKTACPWRTRPETEFDPRARLEGKTTEAAHGKFDAFASDMRRESHLVTVVYQNNKHGLVESSLLNGLIASGRVKKFLRSDGWADIGISPLRGNDGRRNGIEERDNPKKEQLAGCRRSPDIISLVVIPAKAGIQKCLKTLDSRIHGND